MVLYKDKVYNIQIRYQEESQVYLLGTGLRGKEVRTLVFTLCPDPILYSNYAVESHAVWQLCC